MSYRKDRKTGRRFPATLLLALALVALQADRAPAQEHERDRDEQVEEHEHDDAHEHEGHGDHDVHGIADPAGDHHFGLHFTHPLIAESVSPDTKIRIDHQFLDLPDGDQLNVGVLEGEYAFMRAFSVEAGIPYSYTDAAFGNLEVALKFANFALERSGILLGYGVEFGFPTAAEHEEPELVPVQARLGATLDGSSRVSRVDARPLSSSSGGELGEPEWELAPFLNIGYKRGALELVAWGALGVPFAQDDGEEVSTELGYNLSALYHLSGRWQAVLELDGSGGISGPTVGEDVLNLSPGLRWRVLADAPLVVGTSVGFPLTHEESFGTRWVTSLFWHF